MWKNIDSTMPTTGREVTNDKLAHALKSKSHFTKAEWDGFGLKGLFYDDFIKSGDVYFKPDEARKPHPLPATVMCIDDGIKKLCNLGAESDQATSEIEFFRGLKDTQVDSEFMKNGGTQTSPMSTTKDYRVACGYAVRKGKTNGSLLMKIVTANNLQRGGDLAFLSMFPAESETLFPPLTFVQPTGKTQEITCKQGDKIFVLTIIEVKPTIPARS